jgi:spermidine synthase
MTLRVKKVLHHEKSKYQDVLIFESTDHGNVLVLDNVIQCTERDEFSYQEMITHLAMNSHPDPKKVLVIGGGDGGVLREVVKHECVEEAILCDIDEVCLDVRSMDNASHLHAPQAVIRLSKQYLPHMAAGFKHDKVKVHIGDGFKFLDDYKNTFDVIITDSSDPEGPAESLFQKPYFKLLHDALREGGVITTQGCMSHLLEKVETWEERPFFFRARSTQRCLIQPCNSLRRLPSGSSSRLSPCGEIPSFPQSLLFPIMSPYSPTSLQPPSVTTPRYDQAN